MSQSNMIGPIREIPQSLAGEAALLGSIILEPACLAEVSQIVNVESFYRYEHRYLYEAMLRLAQREPGDSFDAVLVRDELVRMHKMEEIGGVEYLARILDSVPSAANAVYCAKLVKDKQVLRELIRAGGEICEKAYDQCEEPAELLDQAEASIFAIGRREKVSSVRDIRELLPAAYNAVETRDPGKLTGISSGFYKLDELTCGFQKGDVIILAGRPSMGKTSLALNIVEDMLFNSNISVGMFSLEMGCLALAERLMISNTRLPLQKVRKGELDFRGYAQLADSVSRFAATNMWIDDVSVLTPLSLRAKARRLKSAYKIGLIVIDYLQLMSIHEGNRYENRQQEITKISLSIKSLAMELKVPILLLSQLNRASASRSNYLPRLTDLRESGSIEQDADVVLLLHREDYYHRGERDYVNTNTADLIVAKQRNGPTGTVKLTFCPELARFENCSPVPA